METDVVQKRAATLKGVMIYLGTYMNKLCSDMQVTAFIILFRIVINKR